VRIQVTLQRFRKNYVVSDIYISVSSSCIINFMQGAVITFAVKKSWTASINPSGVGNP